MNYIILPWLIDFQIMILGYKLTYPSGTATAHLINSFHTPQGAKLAGKQISVLFKSLASSFIWSFFQWFYSGGSDCGFNNFPTFGLQAYRNRCHTVYQIKASKFTCTIKQIFNF